jgi:hypothetical protein
MQPTYHRYTTLFGHVTFGVLAVLALVFWRERTMMLDASFQSFDIINNGKLAIQVQRFGAAFVQSFPLLASKMGLSLKIVLMSYSLAFVLFHWLCFFICDKLLKNKNLALGVLLWYVLMTAHTFYWAQNEVIQGISLIFVYFALLIHRLEFSKLRWWDYPLPILSGSAISIGLSFTLVYFHPLIIFPFCFMWFYFFINKIASRTQSSEDLSRVLGTEDYTHPLSKSSEDYATPKLSYGLLAWSMLGFIVANCVKFYVTGVSAYDKGSTGRLSQIYKRILSNWLLDPAKNCFGGIVLMIFHLFCLFYWAFQAFIFGKNNFGNWLCFLFPHWVLFSLLQPLIWTAKIGSISKANI